MTRDEYRAALESLHLSQVEAARILGADPRTSRRWALGEREIPPAVAKLLRLLCSGKVTLEDVRNA